MSDKNKRKGLDIISQIGQAARRASQTSGSEEDKRETNTRGHYGSYEGYKDIVVNKAMQGDKYKINFSLSEEAAQKIQYIQALDSVGIRDYSKIAEVAIDVLYEIRFLLDTRVVDKDAQEIIRQLRSMKEEKQEV